VVKRSTFIDFKLIFEFDNWKFDEESFKLLERLLLYDEVSHTDLLLLKYLVEDEVIEKELKVLVVSVEVPLGEH
jgi:hypothetical protein